MVPLWFVCLIWVLILVASILLSPEWASIYMESLSRERDFPLWEHVETTLGITDVLSFGVLFGIAALLVTKDIHRFQEARYFFIGACGILAIRLIAVTYSKLSGMWRAVLIMAISATMIFGMQYLLGIADEAQEDYQIEALRKFTEEYEAALAKHGHQVANIPNKAPVVAAKLPQALPQQKRTHSPKVKLWSESFMFPFVTAGMEVGIAEEDLRGDFEHRDPLWQTYMTIREFCQSTGTIDYKVMQYVPMETQKAVDVANDCLRYAIFRWIAEIQDPIETFSYKSGVGGSSHLDTAVPVPDGEQYDQQKLEDLLKALRFGGQANERHWFWESLHKFKFEVPRGTQIELGKNSITYANPSYKLEFVIHYSGMNRGLASLPVGFQLDSGPSPVAGPVSIDGFIFATTGRFEWYGDYVESEPYTDWVTGLFESLNKRLKQPSVP